MNVDADRGVRVDLTLVAAAVVQLRRLDLQRPITRVAEFHRQPVVVRVRRRADGQQLDVAVDVPQPGNLPASKNIQTNNEINLLDCCWRLIISRLLGRHDIVPSLSD